jgi:AbrB family looped-hinge helix DNA binding protein
MLATRVGRRGQIILPKEARMIIKIAEGNLIAFVIDSKRVIMKPIAHSMLHLRGRVRVSQKLYFETTRNQVKAKP